MVEFFMYLVIFLWCTLMFWRQISNFFNPPIMLKFFCPPEKTVNWTAKCLKKINRKSLINDESIAKLCIFGSNNS